LRKSIFNIGVKSYFAIFVVVATETFIITIKRE